MDNVSGGELLEAGQRGRELKESSGVFGMTFVADSQPLIVGEPGVLRSIFRWCRPRRSFRSTSRRDARNDAALAQSSAMNVVVIALVDPRLTRLAPTGTVPA